MDEEPEPLAGHLFFLPGNRWRYLRYELSPNLTSGKMKMMFQTLVDCGLELGTILEKSLVMKRLLKSKLSWLGAVEM